MIESFGGPKIGSIGFAFGLDRIAEMISFNIEKYDNLKNKLDILIAYLNDEEKQEIINIAYDLRKEFNVELINKKITIKQLFKQNYQLKPNILIFKELNSKENEIKMKINEKEFVFEYRNVEDFKNKLKEVK
ncbi:histidyl-tRNA synthetase [Chlamydia trachomatis]|nr:histidyl-tRNA synthetase [Chlamydia trachomatis]